MVLITSGNGLSGEVGARRGQAVSGYEMGWRGETSVLKEVGHPDRSAGWGLVEQVGRESGRREGTACVTPARGCSGGDEVRSPVFHRPLPGVWLWPLA